MSSIITDGTAAVAFGEPVTVAEFKAHSRIDTTADDVIIAGYITAARKAIEKKIHRLIGIQKLELSLASWPYEREIVIPTTPLQSVISIKYTDKDGVETVMLDTEASPPVTSSILVSGGLNLDNHPGFIQLKYGQAWPTTELYPGYPIVIRFTAGIPLDANFPAPIKQAILMTVAHWYEHREAVSSEGVGEVPMGVDWLISGEMNTTYV